MQECLKWPGKHLGWKWYVKQFLQKPAELNACFPSKCPKWEIHSHSKQFPPICSTRFKRLSFRLQITVNCVGSPLSGASCRKIPTLPQSSLVLNRTNMRQKILPSKCYHLEKDTEWFQGEVLRLQVHRGASHLERAWVAAGGPRKHQREGHNPRLGRQLTCQEGNWRYLDFYREGNEQVLKILN